MAKLINGNGNPAVYANEDSDWFAAIMGNQTSITAIGEKFRADQADANTIEVFDGVIITKEGRRIQLDANQVDLFEIPTGTQGQTNYYIIGYHLYTDTDANQFCEVFVQLMESASDTIPEDTFRGGADDVYISLYRVTQDGLNIDSIDLLLPSISTISKINSDLADLEQEVQNMGMPTLDYTYPLHTFSSGNLSYTATKECYLVGDSKCGDPGQLKINGFQIFESFAHHGSSGYTYDNSSFVFLKLTAGDTVTVSGTANGLHVYEKK